MAIEFSWNAKKAGANLRKHGVSFEEASTIFGDPLSLTIPDPIHSRPGEQRYVVMGISASLRLLVVVHCDHGKEIRIISARLATQRERKDYEEKP